MSFQLLQVKTADHIIEVETLAETIWSEHFTAIMGEEQVAYMLHKFQSAHAIEAQLKAGTQYYLAEFEGQFVGYMVLMPEVSKTVLSKIYTLATVRGQGIGKGMLAFIDKHCRENDIIELCLTVNKLNSKSVAWYQRQGFIIVDELKADIGEGYFIDYFIMKMMLES